MPSAFNKAEARNQAEAQRLHQLIANLKFINKYHNASNSPNWLWYWENNHGNGLSEANIPRIQNAERARNANPANYNLAKIQKKIANIANKIMVRRWMYGYVPKVGAKWVEKSGFKVPQHIPESEVRNFRRVGKPGTWISSHGNPIALGRNTKSGNWRNVLAAEGLLKPVSGKRPVGFKSERNNIPTLKELAWAAKSTNENFETVKTMNNKQLELLSKVGPINWTLLKPKPRPTANNIARQRNTAARKIQGAAKKYLRRKASQRVQGPSPRSPATLARQANLGIMGGARRSPGVLNTRRITWSRNANGKVLIYQTLSKLQLRLTNAQRNALSKMSEKQAMNTIRQLARQR